MAESIALLSLYGDADSGNDDLDDSPVTVADAGGSIMDYAHDKGQGEDAKDFEDAASPGGGAVAIETGEEEVQVQEKVNGEEAQVASAEEDVFARFWQSPPSTPCSEALEAKFAKFLKLKEQGRNFNDHVRKSKGYRNPDYLQLAMMHWNIDEIGSCFNPEVFDPHGYPSSDCVDALD